MDEAQVKDALESLLVAESDLSFAEEHMPYLVEVFEELVQQCTQKYLGMVTGQTESRHPVSRPTSMRDSKKKNSRLDIPRLSLVPFIPMTLRDIYAEEFRKERESQEKDTVRAVRKRGKR